jgi:hypothetical protein
LILPRFARWVDSSGLLLAQRRRASYSREIAPAPGRRRQADPDPKRH